VKKRLIRVTVTHVKMVVLVTSIVITVITAAVFLDGVAQIVKILRKVLVPVALAKMAALVH